MESRIIKYEKLGIFFISLLGSFLHFTFQLSGRSALVATFSAVNESTWEHLKLAIVPAVLWAIMEKKVFKLEANNFLFAKAIGIFLMPVSIIVLFYSYTAILGDNLLIFDISTFIVAVIIGQVASWKIMSREQISQKLELPSLISICLLVSLVILFTFNPPQCFLFKDPISGLYGIIR